jgi:5-methylcytosine-specific restriction enzyme A
MALLRICNGCYRPFDPGEMKRGRCIPCGKEYEREKSRRRRARQGTTSQRGYGTAWQSLVRAAIAAHPYCADCGSTENLTGDHIRPLSRGGANMLTNVRVLCRSCNSARGNRDASASL